MAKGKQASPAPAAKTSRRAIQRSFHQANKALAERLRDEDALYRIPWFALVGPPGSGKRSLPPLANPIGGAEGGETFGLQGRSANRWWFYQNAVLIDFAEGHFGESRATDDKKPGFFSRMIQGSSGKGGWKAVLESWLKIRPHRPLDGMVVTLPVDALLPGRSHTEDVARWTRQAEALAERVHDAQHDLGVHFPVYVVLTGAESLEGFGAYTRAVPETMRDQIFGWSSPYTPDVPYKPEWVSEATASIHEAICQTQLDLLPQSIDIYQRDALYLLPAAFERLDEALQIHLDALFKPTGYRRGLPWRGLYLTGRPAEKISAEADDTADTAIMTLPPGAQAPVAFVRQLFTEKIFVEPGLARIDEDRSKATDQRIRRMRMALVGTVALGALLMTVMSVSTGSRVADLQSRVVPLLEGMRGNHRQMDNKVQISQRKPAAFALEALARLQTSRLTHWAAPTTYLDPLDNALTESITRAMKHWTGEPLLDDLQSKAQSMVVGALEPITRTGVILNDEVAQLLQYAQSVEQLQAAFRWRNEPSKASLADLHSYLYGPITIEGKTLKEALQSNARLYEEAIQDARYMWTPADYDAWRVKLRLRFVDDLAAPFQRAMFSEHPVIQKVMAVRRLVEAQSFLGDERLNTEYKHLKALHESIAELDAVLKARQADWLATESFQASKQYTELLRILSSTAFNSTLGDEPDLGAQFKAQNEKLYLTTRELLLTSSKNLDDKPMLVATLDGRIEMSDALRTLQKALQDLLAQPYMLYTESQQTDFALALNEQGGAREQWNAQLLKKSLDLYGYLQAYLSTPIEGVRPELRTLMHRAARTEMQARAVIILRQATPEKLPGADGEGWAAQAKDALKSRILNLESEAPSIIKNIVALVDLDKELKTNHHTELLTALRRDTLGLLHQVDALFQTEKLYTPNLNFDTFWQGNTTPGVLIFGARDLNDLLGRLEVQRQVVTELAMELSRPLVDILSQVSGARIGEARVEDDERTADDEVFARWRAIIAVLRKYEKKVPGNSLEELERFIEVDLNEITLAGCEQKLKESIVHSNRTNFFEESKYTLAVQMRARCGRMLIRETRASYRVMQAWFNDRLSGRFPFASADQLSEVEPKDIVAFYEQFDRDGPVMALLIDQGRGEALFGTASESVQRFIAKMQSIRPLFAAMIDTKAENPELSLSVEIDFRTNRDSEVNGNKIIDWEALVGQTRITNRDNKRATTWRTGDPVHLCFRWASNAGLRPATDQPSGAQVERRRACFIYEGRWALLRLLTMHAATPSDRGRQPFLRPHTLRFEVETTLAGDGVITSNLAQSQTRIYNRVGLTLPGGQSSYVLPREIPRRAPELTWDNLKTTRLGSK